MSNSENRLHFSHVRPTVAVVVPCFNHGAFLEETVESALAQTYSPTICVVVNDGSDQPQTLAALRRVADRGVRVISQPNRGLASARNAGVQATDAPFFVPLDADDRLDPHFVAQLLPPLLADPAVAYSYCEVRFFGTRDDFWRCPPHDPHRLLFENQCTATSLIRRSAFEQVGGYQTDMLHGFEDWDLWLALTAAGFRGELVPKVLFHYRQYPPGESMLGKLLPRRDEMLRRMIEHHRDLYRTGLLQDVEKDAAEGLDDERLLAELKAYAELDYLSNALAGRLIARFSRTGMLGLPTERLKCWKESRIYRGISAIKRLRLFRWYARRHFGPGHERALAEALWSTNETSPPRNPRAGPAATADQTI